MVRAVADTAGRYAIDHALFADFLTSMRSDLTVTDYPTYADLRAYMHGSAAVIGLQMLPVLGTVVPREEAAPHAAALGVAFQLTNFLRDVGEDLDRGRIYLPADLLAAHGVDRPLLEWSRRTGRHDPRIRNAFGEADAVIRTVYREAEPGIAMLEPRVRPCIRTAFVLYRGILDAAAADDYRVAHRRAVVPRHAARRGRRGRARADPGGTAADAATRPGTGRGCRGGGIPAMNGPRQGRCGRHRCGCGACPLGAAGSDLARGEARRDRRSAEAVRRPAVRQLVRRRRVPGARGKGPPVRTHDRRG